MRSQESSQSRHIGGRCPHQIQPRSAMNVNIEKTGGDGGVAEIPEQSVAANVLSRARRQFNDLPIFYKQERVQDLLARSEQPGCCECGFHVGSGCEELS